MCACLDIYTLRLPVSELQAYNRGPKGVCMLISQAFPPGLLFEIVLGAFGQTNPYPQIRKGWIWTCC